MGRSVDAPLHAPTTPLTARPAPASRREAVEGGGQQAPVQVRDHGRGAAGPMGAKPSGLGASLTGAVGSQQRRAAPPRPASGRRPRTRARAPAPHLRPRCDAAGTGRVSSGCRDEGCTNAWKLWEEIVPLGYRGSYGRVSTYLREKRTSPRPVTAQRPAPRRGNDFRSGPTPSARTTFPASTPSRRASTETATQSSPA